ncbi:hypothetical protein HK101_011724 [Irineochytrium annulatum]|nr:hypothetical protein HK101_011724 [Irineochytrium annulatum]
MSRPLGPTGRLDPNPAVRTDGPPDADIIGSQWGVPTMETKHWDPTPQVSGTMPVKERISYDVREVHWPKPTRKMPQVPETEGVADAGPSADVIDGDATLDPEGESPGTKGVEDGAPSILTSEGEGETPGTKGVGDGVPSATETSTAPEVIESLLCMASGATTGMAPTPTPAAMAVARRTVILCMASASRSKGGQEVDCGGCAPKVIPLETEGLSTHGLVLFTDSGQIMCFDSSVYDCGHTLSSVPRGVLAHTACLVVVARAMARRGIIGWRRLARWLVERTSVAKRNHWKNQIGLVDLANGFGRGERTGVAETNIRIDLAKRFGYGDIEMGAHALVLPPLRLIEGVDVELPKLRILEGGEELPPAMAEYLELDRKLFKRLKARSSALYAGDGVRTIKNYPRVYPVTSYAPNARRTLTLASKDGTIGTLSALPIELVIAILLYVNASSLLRFETTCRVAYTVVLSRESTLWRQRCADRSWVALFPDGVWRAPHCPHLPDKNLIRWRDYYRECNGHNGAKNLEVISSQAAQILDMYQADEEWVGDVRADAEPTPHGPINAEGIAYDGLDDKVFGEEENQEDQLLKFDDGSVRDISDVMGAVRMGKIEAIDHYVARGGDLELEDGGGDTLLHLAVVREMPAVIQMLLQAGAKFDSKYGEERDNILMVAVKTCCPRSLEALISILKGTISVWDANAAGKTPLEVACEWLGPSKAVAKMLEVLFGETGGEEHKLKALIVACLRTSDIWDLIVAALPAGSKLLQKADGNGWTVVGHAVLAAMITRDQAPLRTLKHLASCGLPGAKGFAVPKIKLTAFHLAIIRDELMAASFLAAPHMVDMPILPDASFDHGHLQFAACFAGFAPIHSAAALCRYRAVELLHGCGADLTAVTPLGQTALHLASVGRSGPVEGIPSPTVPRDVHPRNFHVFVGKGYGTEVIPYDPEGLSRYRVVTGAFEAALGERTIRVPGRESEALLLELLQKRGVKVRHKNGMLLKRVQLPEGELRDLFGGKQEVEMSRIGADAVGLKKVTECGAPEVIQLLVETYGCDVNAVDANGKTALDLVIEGGGGYLPDRGRRVEVLRRLGGKRAAELNDGSARKWRLPTI